MEIVSFQGSKHAIILFKGVGLRGGDHAHIGHGPYGCTHVSKFGHHLPFHSPALAAQGRYRTQTLNFGVYWTASHTDLASLPMVTLLNFIASTDCLNKDFYTAIIYRAIIVM